MQSTAPYAVVKTILRSTGLFSDEAAERIIQGRAGNPGMTLAEAAVRFGGGVREDEFLRKAGAFLGLEYVELSSARPSPEALARLPASTVYQCKDVRCA